VYVNGLSIGGGMSYALSCAAPERVAAIGIVSGALLLPWKPCAGVVPVPLIVIHGTDDTATPYHGGTTWVAPQPFPDIPAWVARWAERSGCGDAPRDTALLPNVTRRSYDGCGPGADVVFYTLHGDGHVWPGGGGMPTWLVGQDGGALNATEVMWEFFRARQRPP
jgi:polyhydroxybutyrate depolymerase